MRQPKGLAWILVGIMAMVGVVVACATPAPIAVGSQAIRPHVPYLAQEYKDVSADTWQVLVDLSDSTNYPHIHTNRIILKQMHFDGDLSAAEEWHVNVGVVASTTITDTDVEWIHIGSRMRAAQFLHNWLIPEHGMNLMVSGGDLPFVVTSEITTTTAITSGTVLTTTGSVTGTIGAGDLVLYLEEITGTATMHISVITLYDTE